jgi:hypothetical protein
MNENEAPENPSRREPWNKGKLPGPKPPETEPCVINQDQAARVPSPSEAPVDAAAQ